MEINKIGFRKYIIEVGPSPQEFLNDFSIKLKEKFPKYTFIVVLG